MSAPSPVREWQMALAVARLAPETGMVTMTAAGLLAGNAELERLRSRVLELEAVHEDASGAVLQAIDAARRQALEDAAQIVDGMPPHRWVKGSDQWGQPCPAKVVTTRADCAAAIRALIE